MTREEFLVKLTELKEKFTWKVDYKLHLRGYNEKGTCFCPITAVYYVETGNYVEEGAVNIAAKALKLNVNTVERIIRAADAENNYADLGPDWNFRYEMMDKLGFEYEKANRQRNSGAF